MVFSESALTVAVSAARKYDLTEKCAVGMLQWISVSRMASVPDDNFNRETLFVEVDNSVELHQMPAEL